VTKTKKPKRTRTEIEPIVDPNAIRSLVLSGLPAELTKAVLWKKVRKIDDRVELLYPVEGEVNTGESCLT